MGADFRIRVKVRVVRILGVRSIRVILLTAEGLVMKCFVSLSLVSVFIRVRLILGLLNGRSYGLLVVRV